MYKKEDLLKNKESKRERKIESESMCMCACLMKGEKRELLAREKKDKAKIKMEALNLAK